MFRWFDSLCRGWTDRAASSHRATGGRRGQGIFGLRLQSAEGPTAYRARLEPLERRTLLAVGAELLREINAQPVGLVADSSTLTQVNSWLYFAGRDPAVSTGLELWRVDINGSTAQLVSEIRPGATGSDPKYLRNVNGTLYFTADDGVHGRELWRSDGTSSGTTLVQDILPGTVSSAPVMLAVVNSTLFFGANDGVVGKELWRADSSGAALVKDIRPGAASGTLLGNGTNVNGVVYFNANNGSAGYELWRSDGTCAGTALVKDIRAGTSSSSPKELVNLNGVLWFRASNSTTEGLWQSDGTSTGTTMVASGFFQSTVASFITAHDNLLFFRSSKSFGTSGTKSELWVSDGTSSGAKNVLNRSFPYPFDQLNPTNLASAGGSLYFAGSQANGAELWRSDGTASGTFEVQDIAAGSGSSSPKGFTSLGTAVYFSATDVGGGNELWKTNGTSTGTVRVADIFPGTQSSNPVGLTSTGNALWFVATGPQNLNSRLFRMDLGETPVMVGGGVSTASSVAWSESVKLGGYLYFRSNDGVHGEELWRTDGTSAGTTLVADIRPGSARSFPNQLTVHNGQLYFFANDGATGYELWASDGTCSGTQLVRDIGPSADAATARGLTSYAGRLYFVATDGLSGLGLWSSDGTSTGTQLVHLLRPGNGPSSQSLFTPTAGKLYFSADSQLWSTDGTSAGTEAVYSFANLSGSTAAVELNGRLYFSNWDDYHGDELWTSDGTCSGTHLLKDLAPGTELDYSSYRYVARSSSPGALYNLNGTLFFLAKEHGVFGRLWRSDGTSDGTQMVAPNVGAEELDVLVNVNGVLYFAGSVNGSNDQLWRSDGTCAGTSLVRSFFSSYSVRNVEYLFNAEGQLYFVANDGVGGRELWLSDGTCSGTQLVRDIGPGATAGNVAMVGNLDQVLYFLANDGLNGSELYRTTGNNLPPTLPSAGGPYSFLEGTSLTLAGAASTDPDPGDLLTYSWDVNGDNVFGDAAGLNPTLTWSQLNALGINGAPASFQARVRVDDGHGHIFASPSTTLSVVSASEIGVAFGAVQLADGDTTPGAADGTNFGAPAAGAAVTRQWTITNTGFGTLDLSGGVAITGPNAGDFSVTAPPAAASLATGQSTTFSVRFAPLASGARNATVAIANDDANENPFDFAIRGTGAAGLTPAEIDISAESLNIADGGTAAAFAGWTGVPLGNSADRAFSIQNTGTTALLLTGAPVVVIGGPNAADFSVVAAPGPQFKGVDSSVLTIRFTPTAAGNRTATVTIANTDADENPFDFTVTATAITTQEIDLSLDGQPIADGGSAPLGSGASGWSGVPVGVPIARTFTIQNAGQALLTLSGSPLVSVSGPAAGDFVVTAQPAGTVAGLSSTTFAIQFTPSALGVRKATAVIASNDADEGTFEIQLAGLGGTNGLTLLSADAQPFLLEHPAYTGPTRTAAGWTFFESLEPSGNRAIWQTNGTPQGTLSSAPSFLNPESLVAYAGNLYFQQGGAIWALAPSATPTAPVEFARSSLLAGPKLVGDRLYYGTASEAYLFEIVTLHTFDGTVDQSRPLIWNYPPPDPWYYYQRESYSNIPGVVTEREDGHDLYEYHAGMGYDSDGWDRYYDDRLVEFYDNTYRVDDNVFTSSDRHETLSAERSVIQGKLYFLQHKVSDETYGFFDDYYQEWRTNYSHSESRYWLDWETKTTIRRGSDPGVVVGRLGGQLFFQDSGHLTSRTLSTGVEQNLGPLTALAAIDDAWSHPTPFEFQGYLYFWANDGTHGLELWRSDGTSVGTTLVRDLTPGPAGSLVGGFFAQNGTLYFEANGDLWTTDGSFSGTDLQLDNAQLSAGQNWRIVGGGGDQVWLSIWDNTHQFYGDGLYSFSPVPNQPPTAPGAGGPYAIVAGAGLALNGVAATDPNPSDVLTYSWDVNGDGTFGDAAGLSPTLTWTQLNALGISAAPAMFSVRVRVDDGHGHTVDSAATTLNVALPPETAVSFGAVQLTDGDTTPSATDGSDFGAPAAGVAPIRQWTITNTGPGVLDLSGGVTITGPQATDFSVTSPPAVSSLATGQSTTFRVRFAPIASGVRNATVVINNNDVDEAQFDFAITGIGAAGLTPAEINVTVDATSIPDGGTAPSGSGATSWNNLPLGTGVTRDFSVTNAGTAGLLLTGAPIITITGPNAADFSIVTMPGPQIRGLGASLMAIRFTPSAIGVRTATVTIVNSDSDENPYDFTVTGVGGALVTAAGTGGYRGEIRDFTFTTADASTTAGFRYDIDWDNNGTIDQTFNSTSSSQVVSHVSYTSGTQDLRITITDLDDDTAGTTTLPVTTTDYALRPNASNSALMDLVWGGSAGDDSVVITETGADSVDVLKLLDDGAATSDTQSVRGVTGRVIAYGNPGNDSLNASGLSTKSATLDGSAGNNTLRGGNGGDVLIGGTDGAEGGPSGHRDGSNVIIAGNGTNTIYGNAPVGKKEQTGGNNLIIGGTGVDTIYGNYGVNNQPLADGGEGGNNILIGGAGADTIYTTQSADGGEGAHGSIAIAGTTTYGNTPAGIAALQSILAEWSSSHALAAKQSFIQGTGGTGGLNGTNYLTAGGTVLSDAAIDSIFGDPHGSAHWFFYRLAEDLLSRDKPSDIKTALP